MDTGKRARLKVENTNLAAVNNSPDAEMECSHVRGKLCNAEKMELFSFFDV